MTDRPRSGSSGARILAVGASVAAGIGIMGAMASGAAADERPPPSPSSQRVLVILQPAPMPAPVGRGAAVDAEPQSTTAPVEVPPATLPPAPPPIAVVIESTPAEPVTTTEGS